MLNDYVGGVGQKRGKSISLLFRSPNSFLCRGNEEDHLYHPRTRVVTLFVEADDSWWIFWIGSPLSRSVTEIVDLAIGRSFSH